MCSVFSFCVYSILCAFNVIGINRVLFWLVIVNISEHSVLLIQLLILHIC